MASLPTVRAIGTNRYLPELDGLRAIAILLVITVHMHTRFWEVLNGAFGVTIFFVLSGYLITTLALKSEREVGRLSLRAFYIRRSFRIFPLYYLVLAMYAVLVFLIHFSPEKRPVLAHAMPYYLAYLQEVPYFRGWSAPFFQSWSLGIEEKFYLVWPLLLFVLLGRGGGKHRARIFVTPVLFVFVLLAGPLFQPYACILAGCFLALLCPVLVPERSFRSQISFYLSLGAVLCLHFSLRTEQTAGVPAALYSIAIAVFLYTLLRSETLPKRILQTRPLAYVGRISYGMYLVHLLCLHVALKLTAQPVFAYLLTVFLSIASAAVLHHTVEAPLIQLGRRLASRPGRAESSDRVLLSSASD